MFIVHFQCIALVQAVNKLLLFLFKVKMIRSLIFGKKMIDRSQADSMRGVKNLQRYCNTSWNTFLVDFTGPKVWQEYSSLARIFKGSDD